ncbi:lipopolysaccharide biosynthesis protein [Bifidobacterium vansinderenii]|uniref:Lipopolysaccharide biosynthesis protein n=2 Tax=Bifidobacterium vansinderenii TaxID=1984871 RepID=A0A229VUE1_9BIFI|nr:lipopolysaccharide biosynthesis protein [Bifidobacterium vansinderenii]OXM99242.1 lipopolysaccharide biosynthesis protein [Bifidobacterium vansinderenii]
MSDSKKQMKFSVISGLFWKFAERMSSQLVSVIVTIILARLLMPSDYGTVTLVTIFITIANVFVNDGFGVALIQKKDADDLDFSSVFYFGIAFSIFLYLIIFFGVAPIVADFYNMPILVPVLRVLALQLPIASINSVQQAYVSRKMIFKKFFYATISGTLISAIVGITMAYFGMGVWALVAQYLTNTVINTFTLRTIIGWRPSLQFSLERLKGLFRYGWKLLIQSLMVTIYGNLRSLVIGKVYSANDLAYYDRGSYYPNLIVVNVDAAMSSALFPAMSHEQASVERVKAITRRAIKMSSYIMSPLLVGFAACGTTFVSVLLTDKWLPIVPFLQIICINLLFRPAQTASLQAIKAVGRSDLVLKMDIPIRLFGLTALIVSVQFGTIYIALSEVLVGILGVILYSLGCKKTIGYSLKRLYWDFVSNVLQALVMGVIVFAVGYLNINDILLLFLQIIIGAVAYIVISIVCRNDNFYYLLNTVKEFSGRKK